MLSDEYEDSSGGIATRWAIGFDSRQGKRVFSSPHCPDWNWYPSSLLYNEYVGMFPRGLSDQGVNLTPHLHPVLKPRMVELFLHSPHTSTWRGA
jgi:hypothetical protein